MWLPMFIWSIIWRATENQYSALSGIERAWALSNRQTKVNIELHSFKGCRRKNTFLQNKLKALQLELTRVEVGVYRLRKILSTEEIFFPPKIGYRWQSFSKTSLFNNTSVPVWHCWMNKINYLFAIHPSIQRCKRLQHNLLPIRIFVKRWSKKSLHSKWAQRFNKAKGSFTKRSGRGSGLFKGTEHKNDWPGCDFLWGRKK